ncbi:hypothetical protein [Acidovorax carolinensis]|uniref:hypothetical protein n=1 Tax=Acidovorax carolinensis TaxID=553814 RepID=UPI001F41C8CC|nr:hypothetical protein [Acidovorax carolinensis]
MREALEECGLLLAEPLGGDAPVDALRARAMLREGQPFAQVLAALQLRLQTRQLAPWSRWITPLAPTMGTRRFDTRFLSPRRLPTRPRDTTTRKPPTACGWRRARRWSNTAMAASTWRRRKS